MLDDVACAIDEAALPFRTDEGISSRANLRLLVCETDQTVEAEFRGIRISAMASFCEANDNVVAPISPDSVRDPVIRIGYREDVDGVFVSCTTLRSVSVIAAAERAIGTPVTSSNHVLAWHMLRLAGVPPAAGDPGRLFAA